MLDMKKTDRDYKSNKMGKLNLKVAIKLKFPIEVK